ncbi:hypothetical protein OG568_50390 (plasmid) [Streptomyces sp. NBC_01450]|uniref:hypothetical protein n=1 Tax=Streptomyces sp. NBC_01450 TaxID=2903871 RepID=UPI002E34687D|nr:hypothetical protein [Streptomyces sp. NBC_01450]
MGGLLTELGKRLAERWLTLLVLPGALFLAAAFTARTLGHAHALDLDLLVREVQAWRPTPGAGAGVRLTVLLLLLTLLAAALGIVAQTLGSFVERLWFAADWPLWPWPLRSLADWRVSKRQQRRAEAEAAYERERLRVGESLAVGNAERGANLRSARLVVVRVSQEEPHRPTWSGDRMHAVTLRLARDLDLDLATVWPALWQLLPDASRQQIESTRESLSRATTLAAWAILYALLAVWWWPGLPLAVATFITAQLRLRSATDAYAALVEASVHLYTGELAERLGISGNGILSRRTGWEVTCLLQGRRHLIDLTAHEPQP